MKILGAIVTGTGRKFELTELELDPPRDGEVLVKVAACGVCHTDDAVRNGIIPVPMPAVLGHEGSGVAEAVGGGVTAIKPGDRVGFSYGYCGVCEACRTGRTYGCEENRRLNFSGMHFDGTNRLRLINGLSRDGEAGNDGAVSTIFGQGAFATYAVVHVNNLYHVPDGVGLEFAAPFGCGIQTGAGAVLNYLKPGPASSIVVTGCGAVGLSAVMAAKIAGCAEIIACDVVDSRLDTALSLGATYAINASNVESVPGEVMRVTRGGAHYAIDCTGNGESVRRSLNCTRALGICIVLGATQELTIHVENELMGPGKTLVGIVEGCSLPQIFISKLLEYYARGMFPFDKLIKFYDFADIEQAFEDTKNGIVVKAVLRMGRI